MNPTDPNISPPAAPTPTAPSPPDNNNPSYMDVVTESEKGSKLFGIIPKKALLIAGGAILLLVAVLAIVSIVSSINKAANAEVTTLGTKINELRVIIGYSNNNPINNSVTATVVTETDVITTSYFKEITNVYPAIDPEDYLNEEQVSAIFELNNAKARGNLDSTYAKVLRDQLLSICNQIEILQKSASDAQSEVLTKVYNDFQELASRLPAAN